MATQTAEEVKQHHIEAMGKELGILYNALWNELAWLYTKWEEYVELFGTKPSRIDLVNKAAGHFFKIVQDSLWEDTLLHTARLMDPPKSCGKDNLTIKKCPLCIKDKTLKDKVSELIEVADEKVEFCRDWRNRHIAHKDLGLALSSGAEPLKPASRAKVKEALCSLSDVLNVISMQYMGSTTMFEGVKSLGGALSLLYILDDGLHAKKERLEKLKAGDASDVDYRTREL